MNLTEAFKALDALNEDTFSVSDDGISKLSTFMRDDDDVDVSVIDPEAETEEDIQDSYVGKVILDCKVCHSKVYKDKEDIELDEEQTSANVGEECPYCYTTDGYDIIGEVASFENTDESKDDESINESYRRNNKPRKGVYEAVEYVRWVQLPDGKWKMWGSNPGPELDPNFLDRAREQNNIDYKDAKVSKNGEYPEGADEKDIHDKHRFNESKSIKEGYRGGNDLDDILSWLQDHKQAWDDFCVYFEDVEDEDLTQDMVVDWIAEHDQLYNDFINYFRMTTESIKEEYEPFDDFVSEKFPLAYEKLGDASIDEYIDYFYDMLSPDGIQFMCDQECVPIDCFHTAIEDCYDSYMNESKSIKEGFNDYDVFTQHCIEFYCDSEAADYEADVYCPDNPDDWNIGDPRFVQRAVEYYKQSGYYDPEDWELEESKSIKEDVNNVNVETDDSIVNVNTDDNGKVTVTTEPKVSDNEPNNEVIVPVTDETQATIENGVESVEDEFVDAEFDGFDEEAFDNLGESYLKDVYSNVDSYKTEKVKVLNDSKLVVEGWITFTSGSKKKTSFLFEAKDCTRNGKYRFTGENQQLTRGKKAFTISGALARGKFITESFNYNYRSRDSKGKSTRIYGTLRNRKGRY